MTLGSSKANNASNTYPEDANALSSAGKQEVRHSTSMERFRCAKASRNVGGFRSVLRKRPGARNASAEAAQLRSPRQKAGATQSYSDGLACGTVWDARTGSLQTSGCALFFLVGFACELAADLAENKDARAESKSREPRRAGAGGRTTRFHHVGTGGDRDCWDDAGHVCSAAYPERTELFQGALSGELDPRGDSVRALAGDF